MYVCIYIALDNLELYWYYRQTTIWCITPTLIQIDIVKKVKYMNSYLSGGKNLCDGADSHKELVNDYYFVK